MQGLDFFLGMHFVIADCGYACILQVKRAASPEINYVDDESEKASEIQVICPEGKL